MLLISPFLVFRISIDHLPKLLHERIVYNPCLLIYIFMVLLEQRKYDLKYQG